MSAERLKMFVGGEFKESATDKYYELYNPSTGELTGYAPCCTADEVNAAIAAAKAAFPAWSATPHFTIACPWPWTSSRPWPPRA